ncbi:uncharacterized protein LOC116844390 isoform X2 [Odontomachus brunneus]|uniref:uncharacterized protein LOC116844390 isoform X2 n=1 Tax=Odontomachus brunneus TaxID=486640 RepID=UPI0013F20D9F|nr:uncharacterized protein LOC116844390 isoform X2 [Odontomachus brunneus]
MPHIMEMIFEERFKDRVFTIALLDSMRVIYWKDKVEKYLPKRIIYKLKKYTGGNIPSKELHTMNYFSLQMIMIVKSYHFFISYRCLIAYQVDIFLSARFPDFPDNIDDNPVCNKNKTEKLFNFTYITDKVLSNNVTL